MELKKDGARECIIYKSIELLKTYGLKFSLDLLCAELKISKKTVYKFFPDKETLASAMFEKIFDGLYSEARSLASAEKNFETARRAVKIMQSALKFTDGAIFNRYSLNGKISACAAENVEVIWKATEDILRSCGCATDNPCLKRVVFASLGTLDENNIEDFTRLIAGGKYD